jgi:hypothetical protein
MSQQTEHHSKAAEHHEHAARHHKEAAAHHASGNHEKVAHHAHAAHGHQVQAAHHAGEAAKQDAEAHGSKEISLFKKLRRRWTPPLLLI